ncbi:MAG: flavoprotein, partial [Pseudonocardiaceae bacterium]
MTLPDLTPRLIVGMSGASGAVYGVRILEQLRETPIETHLVLSKAARWTLAEETNLEVGDLEALADVVHPNQN